MKKGSSKSIRDVLLNLSNKENLPFQQVVTRFLHERLLYRLSTSEFKTAFILKGGNLLYAMHGLHTRPTMDIDMLAKNILNNRDTVKEIFSAICELNYADDCVIFDSHNITVFDIAEEKKYSGVRLLINARFDTIKETIQIDIGFGDIITPAPLFLLYPAILKEFESVQIMAYSAETVIAEKFEAMISLGIYNSRMKDFYDVYFLLKNNNIDNKYLREAIRKTFKQRNVSYKENHPLFSEEFVKNPNRIFQWKHFLKKIKAPNLDFPVVVKCIAERLEPIYNTLK
jgi:predicted nucleotidyltransferase component of viral defense system